MVLGLNGVYLGSLTRMSKKGNSYTVASVSNGSGEVLTAIINEGCLDGCELYKSYNFILDYDVRYNNIRITGFLEGAK